MRARKSRLLPVWAAIALAAAILGALTSTGRTQTLAAAPTISAIAPNNGPEAGATKVSIAGAGFSPGARVLFGSTPASQVHVLSTTTITALSPPGSGTVGVVVLDSSGRSAATPYDQFAYDSPPSGPWLGLNGNSSTYLGPLRTFVERGVVYDRSAAIDWTAGERLREGSRQTAAGKAIARDIASGMIPTITIEYRGYEGGFKSDPRFPTEAAGSHSLSEYVNGFVSSATEILHAYPTAGVLFEPINEPWGYTTPEFDAAQYAAVIARLLPAAQAAGIPLTDIYVAATGADLNAAEDVVSGWVQAMYSAQPQLRSEIEGWYLHPYGPPSGTEFHHSRGIESLPATQAEMTSGQNNIIVSEAGYCALDLNGGSPCNAPSRETGQQAATALAQMLEKALPYREEGWLKALIVYSRNDRGWAMQVPGGRLTPSGEALESFASLYALPWSRDPVGEPLATRRSVLGGVSCLSALRCVAVGSYGTSGPAFSGGLLASWNGERWISSSAGTSGADALQSVSCATPESCLAVGVGDPDAGSTMGSESAPIALLWNGAEWREASPPARSHAQLDAVSCSSASACLAVGREGTSPVALLWSDGKWRDVSPPLAGARLDGVSCSSPTECVAVGSQAIGSGPTTALIERWNGWTWSTEAAPTLGATAGELDGVSCAFAHECVAAGSLRSAAGVSQPLVLSFGPIGWTQQSAPLPANADEGRLSAVSCLAFDDCTAAGSYRTETGQLAITEHWNGSEWSARTPVSPPTTDTDLQAISCASRGACVAVGSLQTADGTVLALAEHGESLQPGAG